MNAPLALYKETVRPEWVDYNQHMMDGYYAVVFSYATDAFLDYVGLDAAYRARSGCSTYTAEGHLLFLRELKEGAPLQLTTQLLGYDSKRMHLFHTMSHATERYLAATCEWMMVHVDVKQGQSAPLPPVVAAALATLYAGQATLPWPAQAGRIISLQNKRASSNNSLA